MDGVGHLARSNPPGNIFTIMKTVIVDNRLRGRLKFESMEATKMGTEPHPENWNALAQDRQSPGCFRITMS